MALAHLAGIVAADVLALRAAPLHAGAWVLATGCVALARRARARSALALALVALAGAVSMSARLEAAGDAAPVDRREVVLDGRPCGPSPFGGPRAGMVLCDPVEIDESGRPVPDASWPLRVLVSGSRRDADAEALVRAARSDRIRVRVRPRALTGPRNPGARDERRALARRGIGARVFLADPRLLVGVDAEPALRRPAPGGVLDAWRSRTARRLGAAGPGGALLAALAVGDRRGLGPLHREAFADLGIAHLLAVSGLHVALVVGLALAVLRGLTTRALDRAGVRDPRVVCAVLAWWVAWAYALCAGMGVPLQRALVFAGGFVGAFAAGRRAPPFVGLAVAVHVVGVLDPGAVFDPGAQLSFAAVVALLSAPERASVPGLGDGVVRRTGRFIGLSLRTSALALAGTAPVLAAHGMALGGWGLLVNAVAIPFTAAVLLPAAWSAAALATASNAAEADAVLALCAWPATQMLEGATWLAAMLPSGSPAPAAPPLAVAVGAVLGCAAVRTRREVRRIGLVLAAVLWLRGVAPAAVVPSPPRLVAFDVGQGDAILVEGRRGRLLVDGGRAVPGRSDAGARVVVPGLAALGVTALDVVVASHADVDHRGGLESVLRALPVEALWLPAGGGDEAGFASLVAVARAHGVAIEEIGRASAPRDVGDLRVEPLWPPVIPTPGGSNDRSIVLRVRVARDAVLLTGDVSGRVERRIAAEAGRVRARVLKVAHHGSASSSAEDLLRAVGPAVAVVPAACGAASGLPTDAVLARLEAAGAEIAWTGRDGAVLVPLGADRADRTVRGWAPRRRCRVTGR
jgi:competence protein ComEC